MASGVVSVAWPAKGCSFSCCSKIACNCSLIKAMQDGIGSLLDSFCQHLPGRWAKQRQQFRRSLSEIFMGLLLGLAGLMPIISWMGDCLIGTGFTPFTTEGCLPVLL